jgi:hypothetical protein
MRPEPRFDAALADAIDRLADRLRLGPNGLIRQGGRIDMALGQVSTHPGQRSRANRTEALVNRLYATFYCNPEGACLPSGDDRDLTDALLAANASAAYCGGWWREDQRSATEVLLSSGDRLHLARPDELIPVERFDRRHRLVRPAGSDRLQAGYVHAFGAEVADRYDMMAGVRLYLALGADAAVAAMAALIRLFTADRVPFVLKLPRRTDGYRRTDAGVVYLPRRVAGFAVARVLEIAGELDLGPGTPRFTRALAPGVALADCPPGGDSFGMHRTRLLAQALELQAAGGGRASVLAARVLAAQGIDPSRPWLEPGNADLDLPALPPVPRLPRRRAVPEAGPLAAAARIGRQMMRDALHHGGRATWTGWGVAMSETGPRQGVTSAGPDLYAGTAGVALFLGRLAAATGEADLAAVALAALRHAVAGSAGVEGEGGLTGLPGIAFAAADLASRTECDEAAALRDALLSRWAARRVGAGAGGHDLLSGAAGTIRLLLAIGGDTARALAEVEGRRLLAAAIPGPAGLTELTWPHDPGTSRAPLHGLAHGNAGMALALAGLAEVTGAADLRAAADAALAHEAAAFDPATGNWPDLRLNRFAGRQPEDPGAAPAMLAWCNGSAGSLLAGLAVAGPGWALASPAAGAVAAKLKADLAAPLCDCCPCHGIVGLAETLDLAALALDRPDWTSAAAAAMDEVEARYGEASWPCGIRPDRESPGLFLGLAGIGHGFLRRADPTLPSVLAI